ncbi:MAG: polysulfide reductase NrfD [Chloroflexota bacterium]|nr:polysulfide reductase NrfD [Chloroflexota bacterium]MDQ5865382.1 polysulfide reductase NrfD [Chloroflexota bacterium]
MQDFDTGKKRRKSSPLGAAHTNPRDAYRDVPILKQPTWNHEVAAYFFFGGISAGSALVGSIAEMVGGERHKRLARTAHYVSFAALLPCPPLLIDDLGTPSRFHHMLRIFKPSSPMNLGSWALTVHGAAATLTVLNMLAREDRLPLLAPLFRLPPERLLAGLGIPGAFLLAGYTGVLLGTTSVPVWYTSPLLGGLFMASSLSAGASALSLASAVTGREDQSDHQAMSALGLAFGAADLALMGGYVATSGEAAKHLREGEAGLLMKGAAVALAAALLLEAASLVTGRHGRLLGALAGITGLAGGAMLRWGVVRAGHKSTADREGTLNAMSPRKGSPGWWRRDKGSDP